ncbi:uncharacterized protein LOC126696356 [Quercus robur]|uniref:uncharacterized protein LOC126696356 n=1 Tax=Quercus robur TaxID=38942 RepID=UPI002163C3AC|nr:uncharacterized protein LOC126696356 [Quercus robur]
MDNGRTDPVKHVSHFNQKMTVHSKNETLMCKQGSSALRFLVVFVHKRKGDPENVLNRYWEMFNEIDDNFDDVAIRTFKVGLPTEHGLSKSLTGKPATSVRQLVDQIDKYKQVEEDQQQGKGKGKVIPQEKRDFRSNRYSNNRPQRNFAGQPGPTAPQMANTVFREPVYQVLEKIKNESYFK